MAGAAPLVSVIIPVHDRPLLLRRALDSVVGQGLGDWEAIVVDDASATPVAASDLPADPRIRLLRHLRNRGPAAARNTGLAAARGRFVAFLDSDDEWREDKLARQAAELAAADRPRVLVSGCEQRGGGAARLRPERAKRPGERIAAYLYFANQFAQASGILAPTSLARAVGFEESLRQYEDHLFLLRAEAAGAEIAVSTEPLARQHVDPRADRLGRRDDPRRALAFLVLAGASMTPEEQMAFRLRCMSGGLGAAAAARLALAALKKRGVPKDAALKLLARGLVGPAAYGALRGARRRAGALTRWST